MLILRQGATATIPLGPFVDEEDGVTPETGLTIAQSDVLISKNGSAFTQKNEPSSATHDTGGWYSINIDTTDTGTLGRGKVSVQVSGALPVWESFVVVSQSVYDMLYTETPIDGLTIDESLVRLVAMASGRCAKRSGSNIVDWYEQDDETISHSLDFEDRQDIARV